MKRYALFAFNGEEMCFVHVLLNALDLDSRGCLVKVVIEGSAAQLIIPLAKEDHPLHELYVSCIEKGIIDCVCRACAHKMGSLEEAQAQRLKLCSNMSGHPSMGSYIEEGYDIITF